MSWNLDWYIDPQRHAVREAFARLLKLDKYKTAADILRDHGGGAKRVSQLDVTYVPAVLRAAYAVLNAHERATTGISTALSGAIIKRRHTMTGKFYILTTAADTSGTPHHVTMPGGRFDCSPGHRRMFLTMFLTLDDCVKAGAAWLKSPNAPAGDVLIIECKTAGAVKMREAPYVFVPAKKQRRKARK